VAQPLSTYLLRQHEPVAINKSKASISSLTSDWMDYQTRNRRIPSYSEWPDFVFAFHDREEIGPKMLARIAKRTGLQPEDL
jgi:hypothetical protein